MIGLGEAATALSSFKTVVDLAKGVNALSTDVTVKLETSKLLGALIDAQAGALQLQNSYAEALERIRTLETELAEVKAARASLGNYRLVTYPTGAQAYEPLLPASFDAAHKLCANCFTKGEKSILQMISGEGCGEVVRCFRCGSTLTLTRPIVDLREHNGPNCF